MCTKNDVNTIVHKIAQTYKDIYSDSLVEVLLYGSHARGDYNEDSDIDLVAIVHGNRLELQKKLDLVWDVSSELELKYEIIISPTVIPHDEFKKYQKVLPYYRNISKEGVKISA